MDPIDKRAAAESDQSDASRPCAAALSPFDEREDRELAAAARDDAGCGTLETEQGRLPLVALDVRASIVDLLARTVVRQTFRNSLDESLEATYIFPLPDRAAVTRFELRVAGRVVVGDLKERGQARADYDRAIREGRRAAIAEEERSGVFTLRVGNLPPREEATVELEMVGPLPVEHDEATFRFPLVVAPRYTPGVPLDGHPVGAGTAWDTDQVPDASRVTPPVLLPGFPNPVRLSLEVELDLPARMPDAGIEGGEFPLRSSLHAVVESPATADPQAAGCWRRRVAVRPGERLNRDFILRFAVGEATLSTQLRTAAAADGDVLALTVLPPRVDASAPLAPRNVVFLLDRSGSMQGWKMVAARRALGRMVDSLIAEDRFAVLAFDNDLEELAPGLLAADDRQRWRALEWLAKIDARGGTDLGPALLAAARRARTSPDSQSGRDDRAGAQSLVVLVTDGQVSGEDQILRQVTSVAGGAPRMLVVGIDEAVNSGFLRRLADQTGGLCELVESQDRLDDSLRRLHRGLGVPVLTDLRLEGLDGALDDERTAPRPLPDLFPGRPLIVTARARLGESPRRVRVSAKDARGTPWSVELAAAAVGAEMATPSDASSESPEARTLLSIWGRARVRDLEDRYAAGLAADPEAAAKEIVATSLATRVLSRFTAFVAVDLQEVVNAGGRNTEQIQPVELPAGWDLSALGAMACAAAPMSVDSFLQEFDTSNGAARRYSKMGGMFATPKTSAGPARKRSSRCGGTDGAADLGAAPEPQLSPLAELLAEGQRIAADELVVLEPSHSVEWRQAGQVVASRQLDDATWDVLLAELAQRLGAAESAECDIQLPGGTLRVKVARRTNGVDQDWTISFAPPRRRFWA